MSKASTSDRVKHEAAGWGTIIVGAILLIMFLPALLGGALGAMAPSAEELTKPIPGNAKRTYGDQATTPTTAAPRTLSQEELDARAKAKEIGDGLAKARAAQPTPQVDPRGNLPSIGQSGSGGLLSLIPGAEGAVRAIGPGLKAIGK